MGWTFGKETLPKLVERHSKQETVEKWFLVTHSIHLGDVNSILWRLHKGTDGKKYISCILYQIDGGQWGYNGYCESSYPYYFSCPLEWLDECPVTSSEWRDGVREYHRKRR